MPSTRTQLATQATRLADAHTEGVIEEGTEPSMMRNAGPRADNHDNGNDSGDEGSNGRETTTTTTVVVVVTTMVVTMVGMMVMMMEAMVTTMKMTEYPLQRNS
jgi:hypothetical protein